MPLPALSSRLLTLAVLGCALVAGCDRGKQEAAQPRPSAAAAQTRADLVGTIDRSHKGSELPDFLLKDAAGREQNLAALKGKPFLLNLWATYCAPCIAELPALARLKQAGTVDVVTVSQDLEESARKVAPFLTQHGAAGLPAWVDPANDLGVQFDVQTLPTTIYYDARGREVWRLVGGHDWSGADTAALLGEAQKSA